MRVSRFVVGIALLLQLWNAGAQQREARRTPLGVQTARPNAPPSPRQTATPTASLEPASIALQRAINAHGGPAFRSIIDSVSEGVLSLHNTDGQYAQLSVTVWRKGQTMAQRTIKSPNGEQRQGTDGSQTWDAFGAFHTSARGPALNFIETQTVRSFANLFEYQTRGSRLRDDGFRMGDRVLTIEEPNGRTTSYVIDGRTSLVAKLEIVTGFAADMLGRPVPNLESYVFSNFRTIKGVATPLKVEHFINDIKVDEMLFASVRYNTGITKDIFHP
jgi:hypothetical protein